MPAAYLSAGSNLGDRKTNLERCVAALAGSGVVIRRVSSYYETEPVGYRDQPWFLNIAVEAETALSPLDLLRLCHEIENAQGRDRPFKDAPRMLDIDILLYGNRVVDLPDLTIPHPRMAERRFVLVPLAEIAPGVVHPVFYKPIIDLLENCPDQSRVERLATGI